ncbi:class I SAM-dependent methyltransferase [Chloroflexota bacterium]
MKISRAKYSKDEGQNLEYFDDHWRRRSIDKIKQVEKDPITKIVREWLEEKSREKGNLRILDGGCGAGRHVIYFGKLGYDIDGVDFSSVAVASGKSFDSSLKISEASVLDLPFGSETFDYYLSFGVLEHFIDGPEEGLKEAHRILKKGGMLFLSVPYMNRLNMVETRISAIKQKLLNKENIVNPTFYEHKFTKKELHLILNGCGFKVLKDYPLEQEVVVIDVVSRYLKKSKALSWLAMKIGILLKLGFPYFSTYRILIVGKRIEPNKDV